MKLNGWQRIGIALSVLWAFGSFISIRKDQINLADALYRDQYHNCSISGPTNISYCDETVSLQAAMDATTNWLDVAFFSLAPIILAWFLALVSVRVLKWIKMGFEKNP